MKKSVLLTVCAILVFGMLFCACNKKAAGTPDNTRGGAMGDIYITVADGNAEVSGVKASVLQNEVEFTQTKYTDVYEVSGKLNYQHNFTAFSNDEILRNGFYLTFDICAAEGVDLTNATFTVRSNGSGASRTFSGSDFSGNKLTVTERIISENGKSYQDIYVTFDLDGAGDEYFAETYTLDLTNIDATLRAFMYGEWPMCMYYQHVTFEDFVEAGQKLVMKLDDEGLTTTTTAALVDLYELFKNPTDADDFEFSSIGSAGRTKALLGQNKYDMIFLQSGRYHTLREKEKYEGNIASAIKLCQLVTEKNPNAVATIFAPYGVQNRISNMFPASAYLGKASTHAEHVALINKEADAMAKALNESGVLKKTVTVAYSGSAFENYSPDPAVVKADLFGVSDGLTGVGSNQNKASAAGAYLMAANLYARAFNASPVGLGVFGQSMYNFDASLKGEDKYLLALLDKYDMTAEDLALKLQKVAYFTAFGKEFTDNVTTTITFESNGGSEVAPVTAEMGATLTAPAAPTRAGYTFRGWFRDTALRQPVEFVFETVPYGDTTMYAAWEKSGETPYTVEHYVETSDGKYKLYKTDSARAFDADKLVYGTLMGVPGYVYNPTHPEGRASAIVSADFNAKIKLYYDRAEYMVSYEYSENYTNVPPIPEETVIKYGETFKVAASPTMSGYTFVGWTSRDAEIKNGQFTMPAGDVILNGYWIEGENLPEIKISTAESIYGKPLSELHDGVSITNYAVRGTLKYSNTFSAYTDEINDDVMEMSEYVNSKYGYGNYLALNITFPATAGAGAAIEFTEGTDDREFLASSGKSFDVVLRVSENADDIKYLYDDGNGKLMSGVIDLKGVKLDRVPGFNTLMASVKAYLDRGADFQYETYSMGKTSKGTGFGHYRHDNKGIAEIGTWQYMTFQDCSRWMQAVFYNALNYDFNGGDGTSEQIDNTKELLYYYKVTGKESAAYKQMILDEYRSILQPGDCIIYKYADDISGHIMLYVGNDTIVHCAGQSFREGNGLNTISGKAYDMDEVEGSLPIDPLSILFDQNHSRGLFSNSNPKSRFGIIRPYEADVVEATPYGILHETYPNLFIEKTTSQPFGYTLGLGDEVTFTTLYKNLGAEDITIDLEEMIPVGATLVSGLEKQTITLNSYDSKTVRVTYRLEQAAIDWMDEEGFTRITFNHKVNGAEMNPLDVQITNALTPEQIAKIQSFDLGALTSTSDFDLMIEFYQKLFGYDLTQRLEGSKDFDTMLKKLVDRHKDSDYLTVNYDLGNSMGETNSTGEILETCVDGMYGGVRVHSINRDNHKFRVKKLTSYNFMPGDIIVYSGASNCKVNDFTQGAGMYIYLGDNKYLSATKDGIKITVADGYTRYNLKDDLETIYVTDMVAQLNGKAFFTVMRPAQVMK